MLLNHLSFAIISLLVHLPGSFAQTIICQTVFQKYYHGSGKDEAVDIISLPGNEMIVAERTTSASAGNYDGLLLHLKESGNILWSKLTGTTGFDDLTKVKVDNGLIAPGTTRSFQNKK